MQLHSDSQLEAPADQISHIEPDQATSTIQEGSQCSELTARSTAREPGDAAAEPERSFASNASSAKELYEMRMRGIRKKREQAKPKKAKPAASNQVAPRTQPLRQKLVEPKKPEPQVARAAVDGDEFYRRNMQWRKQIDDISALKKQVYERERVMNEVRECTFRPTLIAKGPEQKSNNVMNADLNNVNSQEATKSCSGPAVEDRCLQWAAQKKRKKEQTERLRAEYSECTFTPTLFSVEYRNRVCPSYDLKHAERATTNALLTQEFNYFTLKNYLQMNDESVQDLERLCKLYSSGQAVSANKPPGSGAERVAKGAGGAGVSAAQLSQDQRRMLQIAEFVERSDAWLRQVQEKKQRVAEEVAMQRDEENTFHPRVAPKTEILHARKLKQMSQQQPSSDHDLPLQAASGGLLQQQRSDQLYQYYMPKQRQVSRERFEQVGQKRAACKPTGKPPCVQAPQQETTAKTLNRTGQPPREAPVVAPKHEHAIKKHEKRENKHPKGESAPPIDFAAESRKFSKLIEVLSEKLKERPELCRSL